MEKKHTPEPWKASTFLIVAPGSSDSMSGVYGGRSVAHTGCVGNTSEESEANAGRIVTCVNALAGLNPDKLAALMAAVEKGSEHLEELQEAWRTGAIDERDGRGGTRSNRNGEVASGLRNTLAALKGIE